jgi:hypothetical protein
MESTPVKSAAPRADTTPMLTPSSVAEESTPRPGQRIRRSIRFFPSPKRPVGARRASGDVKMEDEEEAEDEDEDEEKEREITYAYYVSDDPEVFDSVGRVVPGFADNSRSVKQLVKMILNEQTGRYYQNDILKRGFKRRYPSSVAETPFPQSIIGGSYTAPISSQTLFLEEDEELARRFIKFDLRPKKGKIARLG